VSKLQLPAPDLFNSRRCYIEIPVLLLLIRVVCYQTRKLCWWPGDLK